MFSDGKIGQGEATEIANRTDTLSYAMLAEISTFHGAKAKDMKLAHQAFLQEQIRFYQQVKLSLILFFTSVKYLFLDFFHLSDYGEAPRCTSAV